MFIDKIRKHLKTIKEINKNILLLLEKENNNYYEIKSEFQMLETKTNEKIDNLMFQLQRQETLQQQQEKLLIGINDREIETLKSFCLKMLSKIDNISVPTIKTDYKIAYTSPDYLVPRGTKNDNSKYYEFNSKLYRLLGSNKIKLLDIGCAGGGFVQSIIEDGSFAIGLEGSDYSKVINRAAWRIIPNNLFTCDVTKPFSVCNSDNEQIQFDVITAWELMEHIKEEDITILLKNIKNHLSNEGLFICSIATFEDFDPVSGTRWHQTVKPKEWWIKTLSDNGFRELEQTIINKGDWLRGSGHVNMDWTEDMNMGFHLVLKKKI